MLTYSNGPTAELYKFQARSEYGHGKRPVRNMGQDIDIEIL